MDIKNMSMIYILISEPNLLDCFKRIITTLANCLNRRFYTHLHFPFSLMQLLYNKLVILLGTRIALYKQSLVPSI